LRRAARKATAFKIPKSSLGYRQNTKGDIVVSQKLNRFLARFGDLGNYIDKEDVDYTGWSKMYPLYTFKDELKNIEPGITEWDDAIEKYKETEYATFISEEGVDVSQN
jgi:hypothetical protein